MKINQLGTNCVLLEFGEPNPDLFRHLYSLRSHLIKTIECDSIVQSYNTLAIYNGKNLQLETIADFEPSIVEPKFHKLKLKIGLDLAIFADAKKSKTLDVLDLFTSIDYTVAAIGFKPNFPYLWGLPEKLYHPRLSTPKPRVPAGSVGIGGKQTGIYPVESPSGWTLIGAVDPSCCQSFEIGDIVKFW